MKKSFSDGKQHNAVVCSFIGFIGNIKNKFNINMLRVGWVQPNKINAVGFHPTYNYHIPHNSKTMMYI